LCAPTRDWAAPDESGARAIGPPSVSDRYANAVSAGHRFPKQKYSLLRQRVPEAGLGGDEALREPQSATDDEILRAHDAGYLRKVTGGEFTPAEICRTGFPWTPLMVERSRRSAGATIEACRAALEGGIGVDLAGGTHHPFRDHGEG